VAEGISETDDGQHAGGPARDRHDLHGDTTLADLLAQVQERPDAGRVEKGQLS
jgi:hypothetical protein